MTRCVEREKKRCVSLALFTVVGSLFTFNLILLGTHLTQSKAIKTFALG